MTEESKPAEDSEKDQILRAMEVFKKFVRIRETLNEYLGFCSIVGIEFKTTCVVASRMLMIQAATLMAAAVDDDDLIENESEESVDQMLSNISKGLLMKLVTDVENLIRELQAKQAAETVSDETSDSKEDNGQHGDLPADATGAGVPDES